MTADQAEKTAALNAPWTVRTPTALLVLADGTIIEGFGLGATGAADELRGCFEPLLSRPVAELSPIEHAILLLGTHELRHNLDTPYRVVINEAIELAKGYGGTDGHKFVNGVLDKLAARLRPEEVEAARAKRG